MQMLETELRVQNRTLKQIRRQGIVALYEIYGSQGLLCGFELIIVKIHPPQKIMGRFYPEREGYPANEDWGTLAWSYGRNYREIADSAFESLCRNQDTPLAV